jgi:hypothetical protein
MATVIKNGWNCAPFLKKKVLLGRHTNEVDPKLNLIIPVEYQN